VPAEEQAHAAAAAPATARNRRRVHPSAPIIPDIPNHSPTDPSPFSRDETRHRDQDYGHVCHDSDRWWLLRENEHARRHRANTHVLSPHAVPVRRRLTVLKDGTTESSGIVFCEAELRSVPASACETCPFLGSNSSAGDTVDCGLSALPIAGYGAVPSFPPAVAAALPVGLALGRQVVCLEDDLPWVDLTRALVLPAGPYGVPVVDHGGALVGILPATAIAHAEWGASRDGVVCVADRAVSAASVHETESLSDAFTTMSVRRARELIVVSDGLQVVGVLRDVDALRFVAHIARTGSRPAPELETC